MVRISILTILSFCSATLTRFADAACGAGPYLEVIDVHMTSDGSLTVKPCMEATFVIGVSLREPASREKWIQLKKRASRRLLINGKVYTNPLDDSYSLNRACRFELGCPEAVDSCEANWSASNTILIVSCQVDLESRSCLFENVGNYEMAFFVEGMEIAASVTITDPTNEERAIIQRVNSPEVLPFLMDPTDKTFATPQNIKLFNELCVTPTSYAPYLSLVLGIGLRPGVGSPAWGAVEEERKRENLLVRYRLLQPVVNMDLGSRVMGIAAFDLAEVAHGLLQFESDQSTRDEYQAISRQMLTKVSGCDLVPRERSLAKEALK